MDPKKFFGELKRRNVYKVAVAYAVVAWLLMQIASQIFPFFEIPNWAVRLVVLLLIIGFPVALILAWAFELTPEGIKRVEDVAPNESITRRTGRKLDFLIIAILLLVIAVFAYQRFWPGQKTGTTAPDKSIAVLPFENRSEDKANAYFADGIQDEILTRLSKIADLKGNLAHIDAALQKRAGKPARDRQATWRRKHRGRKRAEERRRRARERAVDQSGQRFPSLGRYL